MASSVYVNARAKALENSLLGYDRLIRMTESASPLDAIKILSEVNFGDGRVLESELDFESLIKAEEEKLVKFVKETCPLQDFTLFFLIKNDFHNAEAFIKEKHLRLNADSMTGNDGLFGKEFLREKIMVDEYKSFPKELAEALLQIDGEFVSGKATGAVVNSIMKRGLYKVLNRVSKSNKIVREIYNVKADCTNASVALRTRNYNEANKFFVNGGLLTENELKTLCEAPLETLRDKCKFISHGNLIKYAVESAINKEPFSEFEKLSDGYALNYLKKQKYATDGFVPFMLYCYYKKAEIENVRIIMVGLINGLDVGEIKGRLRETYEG